jgi:transcriptional regulator with XRE-family HTH domain
MLALVGHDRALLGSMVRLTSFDRKRLRRRISTHARVLPQHGLGYQRAFMRTPASRVRRYIRAERQRRGWSQADLASAAGIKSRTTIQNLENGSELREGLEAAVEEALGWKVGSIDALREGGEPIRLRQASNSDEPDLRDDVERQLWAVKDLTEDERWQYIDQHRARKRRRTGPRRGQTG